MKYAGELLNNKSWINLGPTMWLKIIYEIGTQIHVDKECAYFMVGLLQKLDQTEPGSIPGNVCNTYISWSNIESI